MAAGGPSPATVVGILVLVAVVVVSVVAMGIGATGDGVRGITLDGVRARVEAWVGATNRVAAADLTHACGVAGSRVHLVVAEGDRCAVAVGGPEGVRGLRVEPTRGDVAVEVEPPEGSVLLAVDADDVDEAMDLAVEAGTTVTLRCRSAPGDDPCELTLGAS